MLSSARYPGHILKFIITYATHPMYALYTLSVTVYKVLTRKSEKAIFQNIFQINYLTSSTSF